MAVRWRRGRPIVQVWDTTQKQNVHVRPSDHGMEPFSGSRRQMERQAKLLEARALEARRRPARGSEETVDSFAGRWAQDYRPHIQPVTERVYEEQVATFVRDFAGRKMSSITREEARAWARRHQGSAKVLTTMFGDALEDKIVETNVFSALRLEQSKGRRDITVLTQAEVDRLAELAVEIHGPEFGVEFAAMIRWGAYTCMRTGETFAARFSRLRDDIYELGSQFSTKLAREVAPKHGSTGEIYVPEPARKAVLGKPRRLGDDLMFRTRTGKQFRQGSLYHAWDKVRAAFRTELPEDHHLRRRVAVDPKDDLDFYELRHAGAAYMLNTLEIEPWVIAEQLRHKDGGHLVVTLYGHPDHREAIKRIRRAYGARVQPIEDARQREVGT